MPESEERTWQNAQRKAATGVATITPGPARSFTEELGLVGRPDAWV
jgi:hypothetical protein